MNKMKKLLAFLLALACILTLAACGNKSDNAGAAGDSATPHLDAIRKKGTLVFGTESTYPPYEFVIMENGESKYVGFDVDIVKLLAEDLGVEYVQSEMAFDSLIPAIQSGIIDMAGSMTPSAERDEVIDFSMLYYDSVNRFIVRKAEADQFNELSDFSGKTVGAQLGTVQNELLGDLLTDSQHLVLPKVSTLVQELKTGNIDAICVEGPVADCYVAAYPDDLAIAVYEKVDEGGGVALTFGEGYDDLNEYASAFLQKLMDSGKLQEMYDANVKLAIDQIVND